MSGQKPRSAPTTTNRTEPPVGDISPQVEAERLLADEYDRPRLALGFDYSEAATEAIKNCNWDTVHQDWQPDYRFASGREGAWVVDRTPEALEELDGALPIDVPPMEDADWALGKQLTHLPRGAVALECPECGEDSMVSEGGISATSAASGEWVAPLTETERATHACTSCRTLFHWPGTKASGREEGGSDGGADADELINSTPEQRARYLERTHGLREPVALAVAYRECGYSVTGIAAQIDSTKGTVSGYLRDVADEYGLEAIETKPASARQGPLGGDR